MKNYEETCKSFKWNVPEYYNFGFDVVDKQENKTALITVSSDGENAVYHSFNDLKLLSNRFANVLKKYNIKKGERVLLMLPRIPEWYISVLGMIKSGVVFMPATTMCTVKDIEYRINRAVAVAVITNTENAEKVDGANCPCLKTKIIVGKRDGWVNYEEEMKNASEKFDGKKTKSSDPLLIYFTSGTTGNPKMVLHTQAYPIGHTVTAKFVQDLRKEDIHWTVADTGWAKTAWGKLFGQWICGAAVVQHNAKGRFSAENTLKIIEKYNVTTFCAPPTIYRMLILEDLSKYDLSKLRHCCSAGEPLNPEIIKIWEKHTGIKILDFYGQTETVALLGNFRCMPMKPGSVGKPTPGHHVSIVDDEGNELPPNEEGHIAVKTEPRAPGLFKEYWKDPEKNNEVFKKGWYYTGDKAYKDKDGYFWFVGRSDDVIKASGYRIGPFEVESALIEHPAVSEAAVVGSPDPVRGEIVKAFVILAPGYKPSEKLTKELQEHVKNVTAPYKYPREIEYVKSLPKTISGKIKRKELREAEFRKKQLLMPQQNARGK